MDKKLCNLIVILVLVVIISKFSMNYLFSLPKEKFNNSKDVYNFTRPFVNLYDNKGNQLNVTLLSRPFWMQKHYDEYEKEIKDKYKIIGITSYQEFPNEPYNPKDNYNLFTNKYQYLKWINMCEGWLHCFKNPEDYFPKGTKLELLSESDFTDTNINKPDPIIKPKYDFLYVCHRDDLNDCSEDEWVAFNKNLKLANKCISKLCKNTDLKGLLVGRKGCNLPEGCNNLKIELTDKLGYYDLQKKYDECKFTFLPNIHDASPRVLTETLCHNKPVLVNKDLIGGWKYVNDKTGLFFTDENDVEEKIKKLLDNYNNYTPRKYFKDNYGTLKYGEKLKNFIYENIDNSFINLKKEDVKYITPEFKRVDYFPKD